MHVENATIPLQSKILASKLEAITNQDRQANLINISQEVVTFVINFNGQSIAKSVVIGGTAKVLSIIIKVTVPSSLY